MYRRSRHGHERKSYDRSMRSREESSAHQTEELLDQADPPRGADFDARRQFYAAQLEKELDGITAEPADLPDEPREAGERGSQAAMDVEPQASSPASEARGRLPGVQPERHAFDDQVIITDTCKHGCKASVCLSGNHLGGQQSVAGRINGEPIVLTSPSHYLLVQPLGTMI